MSSPRDIFVMKDGTSLVPVDRYGRQLVLGLKDDRQYRVKPVLSRSLPHHRKYWGMLSCVVAQTNLGDEHPTEEILHDVLMLNLEYVEHYPPIYGAGPMIEMHKSISFESMDQVQFAKYFEKAEQVLSSVTGVDVAALRREADAA